MTSQSLIQATTGSIVHSASSIVKTLCSRSDILYHIRTIWLFTRSDLKTIVAPSALFAVSNAIIVCLDPWPILRAPMVVFWIWMNLLPFSIANQQSHSAVAEDLINKPWRPMPSNRLSQAQARAVMYASYILALVGAARIGGLKQCLALIVLGTWYNHFGGADHSSLVRNFINACGYLCFISGALEIAVSRDGWSVFGDPKILRWLLVLGGIVQTTVHSQDLPDQEGDSIRGRRTVPLEMGDLQARVAIFVALPLWTLVCVQFWDPHWAIMLLYLALSLVVSWRTLKLRTVDQDKKTFRLWNLWMSGLYMLPLCASRSDLSSQQE